MDASGFLYPVHPEPIVGDNGGPIEGPIDNTGPLTAAKAAALIQKDID